MKGEGKTRGGGGLQPSRVKCKLDPAFGHTHPPAWGGGGLQELSERGEERGTGRRQAGRQHEPPPPPPHDDDVPHTPLTLGQWSD